MDIGAVSSFSATRPTASRTAPAAQAGASADGGKSGGDGAVYISPAIKYDQAARVAVLLFRDADTGETKEQIPSEHVVEAYRRSAGRTPQGLAHTPVSLQGGADERAPVARTGGSSGGASPMAGAPSMPSPAAMAGGSTGGGGPSLSVTV
ncbi:hypothetical protein [Azospirillum sp.]|uniref:hypothetical protein n=1 Tax=Azospirillum sp. TaxID=34012 RepID=UPI002D30E74A|nr:hypothetical protein [Azospirillum sp.]HYD69251.1 hypothetical protein [Azospirillum sp.]